MKKLIVSSLALISTSTFALPIDWHGTLGFDTTSINEYRRISQKTDSSSSGNAGGRGTQEVPLGSGGKSTASWQSYVFRLEPNLLVNDSATIKAELTSGYGRGGRLGDDSRQNQEGGFGNALYGQNTTSGDDLVINKLYMELYSDTATYQIGRHSYHYGLGAFYNAGDDTWDRIPYIRDGVTLKVKLGNFNITPYWARIGSGNSLTKSTRVKETGVSLVYDNVEKDMAFGIHYAKKSNAPFNTDYKADVDLNLPNSAVTTSLGKTDVKITDLYFKKKFGDFKFGVEVPILSGDIGNLTQAETKYNAKAILFESGYKVSDNWSLGFNAGKVSGEDGTSNSFKAMYLNPNYQVANLLFRYNLRAVGDNTLNVYDSYITNAVYLKAIIGYQTEKWNWTGSAIFATAEEAAKTGMTAFNHTTNKTFTANYDQADDLGLEFDLDFNYQWNKEIKIGGSFGYLLTGDYFAYTNTATKNTAQNSYLIQLRTSIDF